MKISSDVSRLIFTMIGALAGVALGLYGMLATFHYYEDLVSQGGIYPLLVVVLFCGGGLVGGGYLAGNLHVWRENAVQRKKDASKKKYGRKKR